MSHRDWTPAVHAYLSQGPTSPLRGRPTQLVDHWSGQDHLLWRFHVQDHPDVVVKLFTDAGQVRSRRQYRGQAHFAPLGLAPHPLAYDRYPHGLPRQVLIYHWVDAPPLDLTDPAQQQALAHALAQVHRADPAEVGRFSPHPVDLAYFWRTWQGPQDQIARELRRRAGEDVAGLFQTLWHAAAARVNQALPHFGQTPPAVIHGDPTTENLLWRDGQVVFLDWELYGLGDPAQEVARFLFRHGRALGPDGRQAWLRTYLAHHPDPTLPPRIEHYLRLLPLHSLTRLLQGLLEGEKPLDLSGEQTSTLAEILAATFHQAAQDLLPHQAPPTVDALIAVCRAVLDNRPTR